jgi:Prokaryotic E2 family E
MCPPTAKDEVETLQNRGVLVELVAAGGQCYVLARGLLAPAPPWDRATYEILVAVPAAYDAACLDAFYLGLPYEFNGGTHPRVQGAVITVGDRQWQLVSWHYPDGKPWKRGIDDLASHLTHCKGFFLHRGATNDYR